MSELLVQETPADAASILRKAINFTLNGSHAHEVVSLALVRQVSAERSGFVEPARH
jgi:hypothetical protein